VVCCSMISLSHTRYASGRAPAGARHGRFRRWRSYQASRAAGSGVFACGERLTRIDCMGETNRRRGAASLPLPAPASEPPPERRQRGSRISDGASEMRGGFRALGVAASKLAGPIIAKHGGGILLRLKAEWAAIVGPDWAAVSWPTALGRDGALKLCAASGHALELQHRAPLLIERINLFLGRAAITRLALFQGTLPLPTPPSAASPRRLAASEEKNLAEQLVDITDPELRTALGRLGQAVIGIEF